MHEALRPAFADKSAILPDGITINYVHEKGHRLNTAHGHCRFCGEPAINLYEDAAYGPVRDCNRREPTLLEAAQELAEADATLCQYLALPMPEEPEVARLNGCLSDARAELYAAFARHGIDKALVDKIGRVL